QQQTKGYPQGKQRLPRPALAVVSISLKLNRDVMSHSLHPSAVVPGNQLRERIPHRQEGYLMAEVVLANSVKKLPLPRG
ncbi:MAG: hypothetical protein ACK53L_31660, partial [Pirellulaceae bacterium]